MLGKALDGLSYCDESAFNRLDRQIRVILKLARDASLDDISAIGILPIVFSIGAPTGKLVYAEAVDRSDERQLTFRIDLWVEMAMEIWTRRFMWAFKPEAQWTL